MQTSPARGERSVPPNEVIGLLVPPLPVGANHAAQRLNSPLRCRAHSVEPVDGFRPCHDICGLLGAGSRCIPNGRQARSPAVTGPDAVANVRVCWDMRGEALRAAGVPPPGHASQWRCDPSDATSTCNRRGGLGDASQMPVSSGPEGASGRRWRRARECPTAIA